MNYFEFLARYPLSRPKAFLYAVSGEPESYRDDIVHMIRARHRPSDLDYHRATIQNETQALQLLTLQPTRGHRLIELTDFEQWKSRDYLTEWLKSRSMPNIIPVFVSHSRSPDTKNEFAQIIIRKGWWIVCHRPTFDSVLNYVSQRYSLPEQQSRVVLDYAGVDLARIQTVMLKLKYYTDGRLPSLTDIRDVATGISSTVYAVVDDILEGRKARALANMDAGSILGILTLLQRRLVALVKIRQGLQRQASVVDLAQEANMPLFLIPGMIERAKMISFERAAKLMTLIAQADADITVRDFDSETVIRSLLLQM